MAEPYTPTEERIVSAYIAALSRGTDEADRGAQAEVIRGLDQIKAKAAAEAHVHFQHQFNASLPGIVREMRAQGWDAAADYVSSTGNDVLASDMREGNPHREGGA